MWSGGLACIVGALWFVVRVPALLRYDQQQALAARVASDAALDAP
jgi:hypothetical protein